MPTIFHSSAAPERPVRPAPVSGMKPHTRMNLFTCYADYPEGVRFETQEEKEVVVLFLRQHIIVMLPWVLGSIALLLAPTIVIPFIISMLSQTVAVTAGYAIVGTVFWYVAVFGFILVKFIGWYFNMYIVTDERVVDIDFINLLYKQFSQAELARIQDISYSSGGIVATFFNYGNVTIQTAGETPNLEFDKVPRPDKVVEMIRHLAELEEGKNV